MSSRHSSRGTGIGGPLGFPATNRDDQRMVGRLGLCFVLSLDAGIVGGCTPGGGGDEVDIAISNGGSDWSPLEPGDSLDVMWGIVGGVVAMVSIRASGIDPGDPDLPFADPAQPVTVLYVTAAGGDMTESSIGGPYEPVDGIPSRFELTNRFVFLPAMTTDELDGVSLDVAVALTEANGDSWAIGRSLVGRAVQ